MSHKWNELLAKKEAPDEAFVKFGGMVLRDALESYLGYKNRTSMHTRDRITYSTCKNLLRTLKMEMEDEGLSIIPSDTLELVTLENSSLEYKIKFGKRLYEDILGSYNWHCASVRPCKEPPFRYEACLKYLTALNKMRDAN